MKGTAKMTDKETYRNFVIYPTGFTAHPKWREIAYTYSHEDYDGEGDSRTGRASTVEACKAEIDNYWDEDIRE